MEIIGITTVLPLKSIVFPISTGNTICNSRDIFYGDVGKIWW